MNSGLNGLPGAVMTTPLSSFGGGGSTSPTAWVAVDAVEVSSAVASVELPSSGAMDENYEYKVELFGWSLAAAAHVSMQVDLGSGYITSSSYARTLSYIAAGENNPTRLTMASSTVMLLSTDNGDYPISGDIVFAPGHQSTGYSEVRNEFLYRNASGRTVHFSGRNWLTTPTNAAIQRIRLRCSTQNTIAGMFLLLRRPLVA
jgi:hypothetical protein